MSKRDFLQAVAVAALCVAGAGALAQTASAPFPSKTITMIVPYAPGGSSDTRARQVASKMATILGVSVIVDNKPGAAGNIGTDAIAKATADGHVIGIGNLAPLTVNRHLFAKMPFDAATDLAPIALIEKGPLVLLVSSDKSPFKSFGDLVAYGKANPGKLTYASAGTGGAFHLAGELLSAETRVPMLHIPYKGGGPATTDLLAGTVSFMFDMVPSALPYAKANPPKARVLAVANEKRLPQFPDVPTLGELGVKGMEMSNWFGVVAPKGTPPAVVAKLNDAVNRALKDPELADRITSQGNLVGGGTPEEFARFIAAESARWGKVIKERNIRAD
ncbi:MAG TPA: tripartite tricarboxylate transporter substrate binding protein [Ramlibacter sp.]